jgi:hypothetical protein
MSTPGVQPRCCAAIRDWSGCHSPSPVAGLLVVPLEYDTIADDNECFEGLDEAFPRQDRTLHLGLHELHPASFLIASGRPGTGHLCCTYGSVSVRAYCDFS